MRRDEKFTPESVATRSNHTGSRPPDADAVGDEARYSLATRVMSNGVEVIIAGERQSTDLSQQTMQSHSSYSTANKSHLVRLVPGNVQRPYTLSPSTLKNQMILVLPTSAYIMNTDKDTDTDISNVVHDTESESTFQNGQNEPIVQQKKPMTTLLDDANILDNAELANYRFITKTCLTTYTYRTTYLQEDGQTAVDSHERVIANIATEERNYLETSSMQMGMTLTKESNTNNIKDNQQQPPIKLSQQTPKLGVGIFPTTYSFYNTIYDDDLPLVMTTQQTIINTITAPEDYLAYLQPSEDATAVYETNTYYSELGFTTSLSDGGGSTGNSNSNGLLVITTTKLLTQVIVTESRPARSTSTSDGTAQISETYVSKSSSMNRAQQKSSEVLRIASDAMTHNNEDVQFYATKTFMTTFTYLTTTLLPPRTSSSTSVTVSESASKGDFTRKRTVSMETIVNSRTRVLNNIVTEVIPPELLQTGVVERLRAQLLLEEPVVSGVDATVSSGALVAIVTLLDGQAIEVTAAMQRTSNSTTIGHSTISEVETTAPSSQRDSIRIHNRGTAKNTDGPLLSTILRPTDALTLTTTSSPATFLETTTTDNENDNDTALAGSENEALYALPPQIQNTDSFEVTRPSMILVQPQVTPAEKDNTPVNAAATAGERLPLPAAVNQILGSLNLQRLSALRPMLSAMAGLLHNNFQSPTKAAAPVAAAVTSPQNRHQLQPLLSPPPPPQQQQFGSSSAQPIYIPMQSDPSATWPGPLDRQTHANLLMRAAPLRQQPSTPTKDTSGGGGGGISIRPGEVITTNSDVIVGKHDGLQLPRLPHLFNFPQPTANAGGQVGLDLVGDDNVQVTVGSNYMMHQPEPPLPLPSPANNAYYKYNIQFGVLDSTAGQSLSSLSPPPLAPMMLLHKGQRPPQSMNSIPLHHLLQKEHTYPNLHPNLHQIHSQQHPLVSIARRTPPSPPPPPASVQLPPMSLPLSPPPSSSLVTTIKQKKMAPPGYSVASSWGAPLALGLTPPARQSDGWLDYNNNNNDINQLNKELQHNTILEIRHIPPTLSVDLSPTLHGPMSPAVLPVPPLPLPPIPLPSPASGRPSPTQLWHVNMNTAALHHNVDMHAAPLTFQQEQGTGDATDTGTDTDTDDTDINTTDEELLQTIVDRDSAGSGSMHVHNQRRQQEHISTTMPDMMRLSIPLGEQQVAVQLTPNHHDHHHPGHHVAVPQRPRRPERPVYGGHVAVARHPVNWRPPHHSSPTPATTPATSNSGESWHLFVTPPLVPGVTSNSASSLLMLSEHSSGGHGNPQRASPPRDANGQRHPPRGGTPERFQTGQHVNPERPPPRNGNLERPSAGQGSLERSPFQQSNTLRSPPKSSSPQHSPRPIAHTSEPQTTSLQPVTTPAPSVLEPPRTTPTNVGGAGLDSGAKRFVYVARGDVFRQSADVANAKGARPFSIQQPPNTTPATTSKPSQRLSTKPKPEVVSEASPSSPPIRSGAELLQRIGGVAEPTTKTITITTEATPAMATQFLSTSENHRKTPTTPHLMIIQASPVKPTASPTPTMGRPLETVQQQQQLQHTSESTGNDGVHQHQHHHQKRPAIPVAPPEDRPRTTESTLPMKTKTLERVPSSLQTLYKTNTKYFTVTSTKTDIQTIVNTVTDRVLVTNRVLITDRVRISEGAHTTTKTTTTTTVRPTILVAPPPLLSLSSSPPVSLFTHTSTYLLTTTETITVVNTLKEILTIIQPTITSSQLQYSSSTINVPIFPRRDNHKRRPPPQKHSEINFEPNSILVVMTNRLSQPGNVNVENSSDPGATVQGNYLDAPATIIDYDENITFNVADEEQPSPDHNDNDKSMFPAADTTHHTRILIGGVLHADPPTARPTTSPTRPQQNSNNDDQEEVLPDIGAVINQKRLGSAFNCLPKCSPVRNELCAPAMMAAETLDGQDGSWMSRDGNISSVCVCRPGFARMFPDRPCKPAYTFTMQLPMRGVHVTTSMSKDDEHSGMSVTTQKQSLAALHDAIDRMVMQSDLRDVYYGVQMIALEHMHNVSATHEEHDKDLETVASSDDNQVMAKLLLQLSDNHPERRLENVLKKYLRLNNFSIGGTLYTAADGINALHITDFNECKQSAFSDCSPFSHCFNLPGTYTCGCLEGYMDMSPNLQYPGRHCSAEPIGCEACNYHGKCIEEPPLVRETTSSLACECFPWHTGRTCQLNLKMFLIGFIALGVLMLLLLLVCTMLLCRKHCCRAGSGHQQMLPQRFPSTLSTSSSMGSGKVFGLSGDCGGLAATAGIGVAKLPNYLHAGQRLRHAVAAVGRPLRFAGTQSDMAATVSGDTEAIMCRGDTTSESSQQLSMQFATTSGGNTAKRRAKGRTPTLLTNEPMYSVQADRSLTVMIPRAKYHHPSVLPQAGGARQAPPPPKLGNKYQATDESEVAKRCDSMATTTSMSSRPSAIDNQGGGGCSESGGGGDDNEHVVGALVSAGFEVSAIVGESRIHHKTFEVSQSNNLMPDGNIKQITKQLELPIVNEMQTQQQQHTLCLPSSLSYDSQTITTTNSQHTHDVSNHSDANGRMTERDVESTFLMPHTHLYKPDLQPESDLSGFESI